MPTSHPPVRRTTRRRRRVLLLAIGATVAVLATVSGATVEPDVAHADVDDFDPGDADDVVRPPTPSETTVGAVAPVADATPVVGDFDGDGADDVLFHTAAETPDELWLSRDGALQFTRLHWIAGSHRPLVLDVDTDGRDDIYWYGPGNESDVIWFSTGGGAFRSVSTTVSGAYEPVVIDGGILWYGPGSAPDWFTTLAPDGTLGSAERLTINGHYDTIVGDFDGDGDDQILWYSAGPASDWITGFDAAEPGRFPSAQRRTIDGTYTALTADLDVNGHDDIVWYGHGDALDVVWYHGPDGTQAEVFHQPGWYTPAVLDVDGNGLDELLWYSPSSTVIWDGRPEQRWHLDRQPVVAERSQARLDGCHTFEESQTWDSSRCFYPAPGGSVGTLLLIGDSHAVSISDAVQLVAHDLRLDLAVWTRSSCPFVARPVTNREGCEAWQDAGFTLIDTLDPVAVVVANRSPLYVATPIGEDLHVRITDENGVGIDDHELAVDAWDVAFGAMLDALPVPVTLVTTIPDFDAPAPNGSTKTLADVFERRGRPVEREIAAVLARGGRVVDPVPLVCTDLCRQVRGGVPITYDDDHMSPAASLRLVDAIHTSVRTLLMG